MALATTAYETVLSKLACIVVYLGLGVAGFLDVTLMCPGGVFLFVFKKKLITHRGIATDFSFLW